MSQANTPTCPPPCFLPKEDRIRVVGEFQGLM